MIATKSKVRRNHKPTEQELAIRKAIHILQDATDDAIVLMQNHDCDVYIIPSISGEDKYDEDTGKLIYKAGGIEYNVSNGLPIGTEGCPHRSTSYDFYTFAEAVECFEDIVENGWK